MSINATEISYNITQDFYRDRSKQSNHISTILFTILIFFTFFLITKLLQWVKFRKHFNNSNFGLFFGSTEDVMTRLLAKIETCNPTPFNFWLAFIRFVIVDKPEDLQVVLNSTSTLEKSDMYKFFKNTVGEGLFSAPVEKWRKHRRIITPAFNMRLLESFFEIFNRNNQLLVEKLKKELETEKHFDIWKYISSTALDIICETTMGFNLSSEENTKKEFEQALVRASIADSMRIYKPWLHLDAVFAIYAYFTDLRKSYQMMHKLPMQVIQHRKNEFLKRKLESRDDIDDNGNDKYNKTFLDILLDLNEKGAEFTDDDIRDEVVTMMIGGSETSALTNCYTLLMLSMHPHVQEKVYEEISSTIGNENRFIDLKDVQEMTYLEQCIKETLRLFPVGPLLLRKTKDPIKLSNDFIVPRGTNIIIPPLKVHRDAKNYENPLIWNPDNFSAEEANKRHKYTFMAFSGGPRGCIGSKYAMLSMKVTLSKILLNYRLATDMKMEDIKLKIDLLMRSVDGYKIKLYSRKKE
ncbi:cytochrome P450 4C1-like [Planococcus citri]|uniref:cytochrome P450 4C1-like n=1 Tax=Planococcus citri TaxID=170843 RepID=UPI0031F75409